MKALVLLFCLLLPTLAVASPITYDFTGNLGNPNMVWLVVVIQIVVVALVHWCARAGDEALDQIILKKVPCEKGGGPWKPCQQR